MFKRKLFSTNEPDGKFFSDRWYRIDFGGRCDRRDCGARKIVRIIREETHDLQTTSTMVTGKQV